MPRTLIRKNPSNFKTLPLFVEASPDGLSYQSLGQPLNFRQMLERRRPLEVADSQRFAVELANLGVSVRLTLCLQGRDYWVLVRQRRPDRGDTVLKLISGYVPAHELNLPGLRVWQLARYPHLVFYMERPDHIDVWRVLHGQRDIPAWMKDPDVS